MSNLNFEQKQACRTNPLAAYLAKRINWMILLVTVLNLCTVGLAALGAVEPVLQRAVGGVGGPQEGQAEQGGQKEVLEAAHGACSVGRQSRGGPL